MAVSSFRRDAIVVEQVREQEGSIESIESQGGRRGTRAT